MPIVSWTRTADAIRVWRTRRLVLQADELLLKDIGLTRCELVWALVPGVAEAISAGTRDAAPNGQQRRVLPAGITWTARAAPEAKIVGRLARFAVKRG